MAAASLHGDGVISIVRGPLSRDNGMHQTLVLPHGGPQHSMISSRHGASAQVRLMSGQTRVGVTGTARALARITTGPDNEGYINTYGHEGHTSIAVGERSIARAEITNHVPGRMVLADASVYGSGDVSATAERLQKRHLMGRLIGLSLA